MPEVTDYCSLIHKLADQKLRAAVSLKYQAPGEDLDPDNLVKLEGDDDLKVRLHPPPALKSFAMAY